MDLDYWDKIYQHDSNKDDRGRKIVHFPSPFAEFCSDRIIQDNAKVLELGTGNGRDAFFFAEQGYKVFAVDQSQSAINHNNEKAGEMFSDNRLLFLCQDIVEGVSLDEPPSVVYSRFVFHAISSEDQTKIFKWLDKMLSPGALFLIEARTNKDPLCGQGKQITKDTYVCGHYRRFIDSLEFINEALSYGYKLRYFNEDSGLAKYNDEDPVVMRIFLEKI